MKCSFLAVVGLFTAMASPCSATETHLIEVSIPIVGPQFELTIRKVLFQTYYCSPESEISATCWPYVVNRVPEEQPECPERNLNIASLAGLKITQSPSRDRATNKRVVIDVSPMTKLPDATKSEIIRLTVKALESNLTRCRIHNCGVTYAGKERHPDVDWAALPVTLNRSRVPDKQMTDKNQALAPKPARKEIERFQHDATGITVVKENRLVFQEDLDGDGVVERILIRPREDDSFTISINGREVLSDTIDSRVDAAGIVDIQAADTLKEISVFSLGPSDDPTTRYYHYDRGRITFMGEVSCPDEPGDGSLYTEDWRGSWMRYEKYRMGKNFRLEAVSQPSYWVGISVKAASPLFLYSSAGKKSPALEAVGIGEEAVLLLENDPWLLVKSPRNILGWALYSDIDACCPDLPKAD